MNSGDPLFSTLSIAPMIDWTNTHFRVLMRLLAPKALVYTDMQTPGAIVNNSLRALYHHPIEHPIALQLGGSEVDALIKCAQKAERLGFDEVNLNLGCPSDKVQAGQFGACLMAKPALVARCIDALKKTVSIPVTAKTRIGIDKNDSYEFFASFVHQLVDAGCDKLIVHARKAWLKGLNPKQNRTIPPLHYPYVYQIKREYPTLPVVLNGNVACIEDIQDHLQHVDGVMIGRLACKNPYAIALIHKALYPQEALSLRTHVLQQYFDYLQPLIAQNNSWSLLLKPILAMSHGLPNAKCWKEMILNAQRHKNLDLLHQALMRLTNMEQQDTSMML